MRKAATVQIMKGDLRGFLLRVWNDREYFTGDKLIWTPEFSALCRQCSLGFNRRTGDIWDTVTGEVIDTSFFGEAE